MKRCLLTLALLMAVATPASAQGIRGLISDLFIFGGGEDPLFLAGTAGSGATSVQVHAGHFIPSAVESNGSLISFLTTAIGTNVANIPLSSTSAGITFRFEGGVPVATSTSPGPIIAERGQTLGRGRVFIGANHSVLNFKAIRGVDLNSLRLNFTHVNADFPGCDASQGDDCTKVGVPTLENDFIALDLSLDLNVRATTFVLTYGLLDFIDVGVAVPVISTSLVGQSNAQVVPFGGPTAAHFFGGTETEPDLFAENSVSGSASGLGDIATRLKIGFGASSGARFAILGDARFATGDEEDLLGAGDFSFRGMGIVSGQFGSFSPHANVGYVYRRAELQNDAVLATIGFDHLLAPWAMIAVDLVSELQVGENKLVLPQPLTVEEPFIRVIDPTTIPDIRDDIVSGSIGMKFVTSSGLTIVANSIWPLNDGSLRPHVMWTAGLEYGF